MTQKLLEVFFSVFQPEIFFTVTLEQSTITFADGSGSSTKRTRDKAMMAIPRMIVIVVTLSSGSYRWAVGMSSCKQMYTIMPPTNPKTIPYAIGPILSIKTK